MVTVFFLVGLALLVAGAELLVRGAVRLAAAAGVAPLIIGLTVVAFGTSTPELAVTARATLRGDAAIGFGNVVGSNILNVLLILGLSATVAPLLVQRRVIRLEVPLVIGVSALVLALTADGRVGHFDGLLLVALGIAYMAGLVIQTRSRHGRATAEAPAGAPARRTPPRALVLSGVAIVVGLALLVVGAGWMVDAARTMARRLGVSELAIGLTIVAVGTSLPELATSVIASLRGQRDIAVGNVMGSNLFNLLFVLGIAALLSPTGLTPPPAAVAFDLPVMLLVAVVCLPIFFTGQVIARWEGLLLLGYFVAYTSYVLLAASGHHALPTLRAGLLFLALPLTGLTLALAGVREVRLRR